VNLYEARPFMGGKVGSWEDPDGNHIEMGLTSSSSTTPTSSP
jgi:zeta-carotene desaturase